MPDGAESSCAWGFEQFDGVASGIIEQDLLPPIPLKMSLRKRAPALRRLSTIAVCSGIDPSLCRSSDDTSPYAVT